MELAHPCCPVCARPAVEIRQPHRYRRGTRELVVEAVQFRCPGDCPGPRGEVPLVFADLETMKANEALAATAWRSTFGEEMPSGRRWREA
jgi:hypothetical protein